MHERLAAQKFISAGDFHVWQRLAELRITSALREFPELKRQADNKCLEARQEWQNARDKLNATGRCETPILLMDLRQPGEFKEDLFVPSQSAAIGQKPPIIAYTRLPARGKHPDLEESRSCNLMNAIHMPRQRGSYQGNWLLKRMSFSLGCRDTAACNPGPRPFSIDVDPFCRRRLGFPAVYFSGKWPNVFPA